MKSKYLNKKIITTNDDLQNAIIELYQQIKIRIKDDKRILQEEDKQREYSNLRKISPFTVIDYIKKSIDIIINFKGEEKFHDYLKSYMSSIQNSNQLQYESQLQKQEEQIRSLYRKEMQFRFKISSLEEKIIDYESMISSYENNMNINMYELQKSSSFTNSKSKFEKKDGLVDDKVVRVNEYTQNFIRLSDYDNDNHDVSIEKNINHDLIMSFGGKYNNYNPANQNNLSSFKTHQNENIIKNHNCKSVSKDEDEDEAEGEGEDNKNKPLILNVLNSKINTTPIKEPNKDLNEIEKKIQKQRIDFSNKLQQMEIEYKQKIDKLTEKIEKFEDDSSNISYKQYNIYNDNDNKDKDKDKEDNININKYTRNHQSPFEEYENEIKEKEKEIKAIKEDNLYNKVLKANKSTTKIENSFIKSNSTMKNKDNKGFIKETKQNKDNKDNKDNKRQSIQTKQIRNETSSKKTTYNNKKTMHSVNKNENKKLFLIETSKNTSSLIPLSPTSTYIYQTIHNNYNINNKKLNKNDKNDKNINKSEYKSSIGNVTETETLNSNKETNIDLYDSNKTKIINSTEDSDDEKNFTFRNSFSSNINSSEYANNKTLHTNNTNKSNCKVLSTITIEDFSKTERNDNVKFNKFQSKSKSKPKPNSKSKSKDYNFQPSLQISPLINNLIKEVSLNKGHSSKAEIYKKIKNNYSSSTNLNLIDECFKKIPEFGNIMSIRNSSVNSKKSSIERNTMLSNRTKAKINSHYNDE